MTEQTPTPAAVREALYDVEDPELGLSILELGLVYDVEISAEGAATVTMTLTSPACPVGPLLQKLVGTAACRVPGVVSADVQITFDPPWDPHSMASEDVKLSLGIW